MSAERFASRREEDGYTVLEVMIASAILMVVSALAFAGVISLTNNENRTSAMVANEQAVRFVLNDFARDIRGADPLTIWGTANEFAYKLRMEVGPTGSESTVLWQYDPSTLEITRQVVSGPGAGSPVTRLRRVRNEARGVPFLRYFDSSAASDADELVASGETPAHIANCSIRVRITITADSEPGPEPFTETLDVHLRNRLPGGFGCPT